MQFEIPCLPGERVYFLDEKTEKEGRKKIQRTFVNSGIVDHITIGGALSPIITVCDEENTWTDFDIGEDLGVNVFITHEEAVERMKKEGEESEQNG